MAILRKRENPKKKANNFNKLKYGFKKKAEEIALEFRAKLGIAASEPLPAFGLAEYLELEVKTLHQIPLASDSIIRELLLTEKSNHWSGFIIGINKPTLIIYNCSHSKARIESTIMHECSHSILEHPMSPIDLSSEIPRNEYPAEQEAEAEWLSGCLLLPKPALIKYYIYKKFTLEQIADYFGVSIQMVNYRLSVSGVLIIKNRMTKKK